VENLLDITFLTKRQNLIAYFHALGILLLNIEPVHVIYNSFKYLKKIDGLSHKENN
jgi:hypothetical protein